MDGLKDHSSTVVDVTIGLLAELGEPLEALQWIEHLEKRVPASVGFERSRLVMQGAEIAMHAGMMNVMEEYLQRILGMQHLFSRKCDRGWAEKCVREFRSDHGLLAARDAQGDKQRAKSSFNALVRSAW